MPYPTVPDLKAFDPAASPNLMAGGPYDEQLTAIEDYLRQLGSYVDKRADAIAEQIAGLETAVESVGQRLSAVVTGLNGVTYGSDPSYALFEGLTVDGGTVTSPALAQVGEQLSVVSAEIDTLQGQVAEDQGSIAELGNDVNELSQWQVNASNVSVAVPTAIASAGGAVETTPVKLLGASGKTGGALEALANVAGNLMLAAPNDDQSSVLGWLGDNSYGLVNAPKVQSSAALTAAYESGGSAADQGTYGVPVTLAGEVGSPATIASYEPVTLRANDTAVVAGSSEGMLRVGTVMRYVGDSELALSTEPVEFAAADFETVWEPEDGTGGIAYNADTHKLVNPDGTDVDLIVTTRVEADILEFNKSIQGLSNTFFVKKHSSGGSSPDRPAIEMRGGENAMFIWAGTGKAGLSTSTSYTVLCPSTMRGHADKLTCDLLANATVAADKFQQPGRAYLLNINT